MCAFNKDFNIRDVHVCFQLVWPSRLSYHPGPVVPGGCLRKALGPRW